MRATSLTLNIKFNDNDTIDVITPEMNGEIDTLLLCRFLNTVSDVRDQYNKERQEE